MRFTLLILALFVLISGTQSEQRQGAQRDSAAPDVRHCHDALGDCEYIYDWQSEHYEQQAPSDAPQGTAGSHVPVIVSQDGGCFAEFQETASSMDQKRSPVADALPSPPVYTHAHGVDAANGNRASKGDWIMSYSNVHSSFANLHGSSGQLFDICTITVGTAVLAALLVYLLSAKSRALKRLNNRKSRKGLAALVQEEQQWSIASITHSWTTSAWFQFVFLATSSAVGLVWREWDWLVLIVVILHPILLCFAGYAIAACWIVSKAAVLALLSAGYIIAVAVHQSVHKAAHHVMLWAAQSGIACRKCFHNLKDRWACSSSDLSMRRSSSSTTSSSRCSVSSSSSSSKQDSQGRRRKSKLGNINDSDASTMSVPAQQTSSSSGDDALVRKALPGDSGPGQKADQTCPTDAAEGSAPASAAARGSSESSKQQQEAPPQLIVTSAAPAVFLRSKLSKKQAAAVPKAKPAAAATCTSIAAASVAIAPVHPVPNTSVPELKTELDVLAKPNIRSRDQQVFEAKPQLKSTKDKKVPSTGKPAPLVVSAAAAAAAAAAAPPSSSKTAATAATSRGAAAAAAAAAEAAQLPKAASTAVAPSPSSSSSSSQPRAPTWVAAATTPTAAAAAEPGTPPAGKPTVYRLNRQDSSSSTTSSSSSSEPASPKSPQSGNCPVTSLLGYRADTPTALSFNAAAAAAMPSPKQALAPPAAAKSEAANAAAAAVALDDAANNKAVPPAPPAVRALPASYAAAAALAAAACGYDASALDSFAAGSTAWQAQLEAVQAVQPTAVPQAVHAGSTQPEAKQPGEVQQAAQASLAVHVVSEPSFSNELDSAASGTSAAITASTDALKALHDAGEDTGLAASEAAVLDSHYSLFNSQSPLQAALAAAAVTTTAAATAPPQPPPAPPPAPAAIKALAKPSAPLRSSQQILMIGRSRKAPVVNVLGVSSSSSSGSGGAATSSDSSSSSSSNIGEGIPAACNPTPWQQLFKWPHNTRATSAFAAAAVALPISAAPVAALPPAATMLPVSSAGVVLPVSAAGAAAMLPMPVVPPAAVLPVSAAAAAVQPAVSAGFGQPWYHWQPPRLLAQLSEQLSAQLSFTTGRALLPGDLFEDD